MHNMPSNIKLACVGRLGDDDVILMIHSAIEPTKVARNFGEPFAKGKG